MKKRVNYLLVLREAQRAYIEYKRIPPNPRLEGYDYTTLNSNILVSRVWVLSCIHILIWGYSTQIFSSASLLLFSPFITITISR